MIVKPHETFSIPNRDYNANRGLLDRHCTPLGDTRAAMVTLRYDFPSALLTEAELIAKLR